MTLLDRAAGCLLGQIAGDSLGSLVEFYTEEQISREYPQGVRVLADGGVWDLLAGQPTDDSELALALARTLSRAKLWAKSYNQGEARAGYKVWLDSKPFDCGRTTMKGLLGQPDFSSEANGALMRVSPLGIFGQGATLKQVAEWARLDAEITHPNPVCVAVNSLFVAAIAYAVSAQVTPQGLYQAVLSWVDYLEAPSKVKTVTLAAESELPADYQTNMGHVLIAWQNALYQLLHADSLEEGVVATVQKGGDTDTNAAITGALLGAVYGQQKIPSQWKEAVLRCRPSVDSVGTSHPRPPAYWPTDVVELACSLAVTR